MPKTLIDANILIEILMGRKKAGECLELLQDRSKTYIVAALTVHIVWYVAEKYHLPEKEVRKIIEEWTLEPLTAQSISLAYERYDGKDFEDCLQAACAELGGCDEIVTLDKNFKKHSGTKLKVKVL